MSNQTVSPRSFRWSDDGLHCLFRPFYLNIKVIGYTFRESNSAIFIFCLPFQWGQLLKERICSMEHILYFNPIALRKAKIVFNFDLSECNRVKGRSTSGRGSLPRKAIGKSQSVIFL